MFSKTFVDVDIAKAVGGNQVMQSTGLVLPADAVIVGGRLTTLKAATKGTGNIRLSRGTVGLSPGDAITTGLTNTIANENRGTTVTVTGVALSVSQEIYFSNGTAPVANVTRKPTMVVTVQWTGSAPVAY